MANPFLQQARYRKVVYTVLILALFTGSLLWRRLVVEPEAFNLQLREQSRGEVELTSAAVRQMLTGSRGVAVTLLWAAAIKKQEKHEWNEVELLVNSITKLQPYFITPWLFQSWNLAFNVAVECDRPRDKYYYISRGLELLAEGERRNQGSGDELALADPSKKRFPGHPDMRHYMGFTYHLKIGTSDEKNTMRCLLDMSCIDPLKRDPQKLLGPGEQRGREVKLKEFLEFCQNHPRLVRRLRDHLGCETPQMVVDFLANNRELPTRYDRPRQGLDTEQSPLKKARQQFPILPPPLGEDWPNPDTQDLTREAFDVHLVGRTWFQFAQLPLPPPHADPGVVEAVYDPVRERIPKHMALHIFRSYPARAQAYIAENLQAEGFFDDEGWVIKKWFDRYGGPNEPDQVVGWQEKYHSQPAWEKSHRLYMSYGIANGLYISPSQIRELNDQAGLFRSTFGVKPGDRINVRKDLRGKADMGKSIDAHLKLAWNEHYRGMTNYDAHLYQTDAERQRPTVIARKFFFHAERLRREAPEAALATYEQAWPLWLDVVLQHSQFGQISTVQEDVYELQLKYLRHMQRQRGGIFKPVAMGLAQLAAWPYPPYDELLSISQKNNIIPIRQVRGPLDWLRFYQGPEAEALRSFLLQWTTAASLPPRMVYPGQEHRMLTMSAFRDTPVPPPWQPLITENTVNQTRQRLGVDRVVETQEKK